MSIVEIAVWDNKVPFRDGPFVMAHATQHFINSRIFTITDNNGTTGTGEIVFGPLVSSEDIAARIADEQSFFPELLGQSIEAINDLSQAFIVRNTSWRAVAFGLNTASLDLQSKQQKIPMSVLLGGVRCEAIPDYLSISEKTLKKVRERMMIASPERGVIQLKLGTRPIDEDCLQLQIVLDLMTENQIVLADANAGWNSSDALQIIGSFNDARIIWEEPCLTYDENARIAEQSGAPVMVDQCMADRDSLVRAISEKRVDSVCIKPPFLGGLDVAREMRDLCVTNDMKMRIDGPYCSDVATAAFLHLAAGTPPELLVASCDLREPLNIKHDLHGVRTLSNGIIAPPTGHGLGIKDVKAVFGKADAVYTG